MDPNDEIIARMTRWADHRTEPPSERTRPTENVHLFDSARAFLRTARPPERRALAAAFASDPSWRLDFYRAVEMGATAGRGDDIGACARGNPWARGDMHDAQEQFAGEAILTIAVVADLVAPDLTARLLGPFRVALGPRIEIRDQEISGIVDARADMLAGVDFLRCTFVGCGVRGSTDPGRRTVVRDVRLTRCKSNGLHIGPAIIENVVVDGLTCYKATMLSGAVFRHVTLEGRIGQIIYNPEYAWRIDRDYDPRLEQAFREANAAYWASVDWALDIREARFSSVTLRGIPAHLVRRDPATQVVVTREKALEGRWRSLAVERTGFAPALGNLSRSDHADEVLVAPKASPGFERDLAALRMLREEGIAEPD